MDDHLQLVDASTREHFAAMSLIHALGWRTTYQNALPADYLSREITDGRWIPFFEEGLRTGSSRGLLLYCGGIPVSCCSYGPARSPDYEGWGEIFSFYTHPDHKGRGYGGVLMAEVLRRLKGLEFPRCYVLVLRENEAARHFYAGHGFSWDGTQEEIPFPPDTVCVDLRYGKEL